MKKILAATFLLFTFFLPSDSQNPEPQKSEKASGSIVRGRVIYEDTGNPVRRGLIGLLNIKDNFGQFEDPDSFNISNIDIDEFALTNDDGEFEIKDVKAGDYYSFVKVPNVLNLQSVNKFYENNITVAVSKFENLFQKIAVDGVSEINALIGVKRGASISGRVTYSDGSAAINFKVEIVRKRVDRWDDEIVEVAEIFTDDRGFYRVTELLAGEYYVKVIEPSDHRGSVVAEFYNFTRSSELKLFYPDALNMESAKPIEVNWGQEQNNIDITIPNRKLFEISGTLIAKASRQPVANALMTFQKIDESDDVKSNYSNELNATRTDEKGNWFFKYLPQGMYRVKFTGLRDDSGKFASAYKEIKIENENVQDIKIELPSESSVSGNIKVEGGKSLPNVFLIYLFDKDSKTEFNTSQYINYGGKNNESKKESKFRIGALTKGNYDFSFHMTEGFYVKSVKLNNAELTKESFEIGEEQAIENVEIILADDVGTLRGKLFESENSPARVASIALIPVDSTKQKESNLYFHTITANNGEFEVKAAPGEYFITFPNIEDNKLTKEEWLKKIAQNAEKIVIKSDEIKNISLFLPER